MQVGFASYAKTAWFGRRSHGGETYFKEIEAHVGDGEEYIACCADNTSSNTSMQKGLFGRLNKKFLYYLYILLHMAFPTAQSCLLRLIHHLGSVL